MTLEVRDIHKGWCENGSRNKCFTEWEEEMEKGRKATGENARGKAGKRGASRAEEKKGPK